MLGSLVVVVMSLLAAAASAKSTERQQDSRPTRENLEISAEAGLHQSSTVLLEERRATSEQLRQLGALEVFLDTLRLNADERLRDLERRNTQLTERAVSGALEPVRSALKVIEDVPKAEQVASNSIHVRELDQKLRRVTRQLDVYSYSLYDEDYRALLPAQRAVLRELDPPLRRDDDEMDYALPSLNGLMDSLYQDRSVKRSEIENPLQAATEELAAAKPDQLVVEAQSRLTKAVGRAEKKRAVVIAKQAEIETERKRLGLRLAAIDSRLDQLARGGQSETFESIYWMMILLGLMFMVVVGGRLIAMRMESAAGNQPIIADRTLIEFGGMSFILLTIIILGNTGKLEHNVLGALLGTIAGYVFGKGSAAAERRFDGGNGDRSGRQEDAAKPEEA